MSQPRNVEAILRWAADNRPDLLDHLKQITSSNAPNMHGLILLMTTSFEAGRMFQAELADAVRYVPLETPY